MPEEGSGIAREGQGEACAPGATLGGVLKWLEEGVYLSHFLPSSPSPHDYQLHWNLVMCTKGIYAYTPIAFDERVTFWLQRAGHCHVHACLLHCMHAQLRNGYTQAYAQIMQHMHTHKAVTRHVEAKKLLSHRRQSTYSTKINSYKHYVFL